MAENRVPVEYIVTKYFVKYQKLNELISMAFAGSKANRINLYIDLYGIYKTLFSRTYRTDITDYTAFVSIIINMCSHYRAYFKGLGVYCKIFLISSYNIPEVNLKFVAGYNKTFVDKLKNQQVRDMIEMNIQLLEILCPYLPEIHFIKTDFESTVLMKHIILKEMSEGNNDPNLIISTDLYPLQLCSEFENTCFLKPKKWNQEDLSAITAPKGHPMHEKSFWSIVCRERDNLMSDASEVSISPSNMMLLMSLNRFPDRNFKNLIHFKVANNIIFDIVGSEPIKLDINTLYDNSKQLSDKVPKSVVESRYKALDVNYQYLLFENSVEPHIIHYENLDDPTAVQMINAEYFSKNPIDLFRL